MVCGIAMKCIIGFAIYYCFLISLTAAALHPNIHNIFGRLEKRATTAVVAPTYVYIPTTLANGVVETVAGIYVQTFSPVATIANAVSSGSIGLPTGAAASASASAAISGTPSSGVLVLSLAMLSCVFLGVIL